MPREATRHWPLQHVCRLACLQIWYAYIAARVEYSKYNYMQATSDACPRLRNLIWCEFQVTLNEVPIRNRSADATQTLLAWLPSWMESTSASQLGRSRPQIDTAEAHSELVLPNWRAGGRGRQCKSLVGVTMSQAITHANEFDRWRYEEILY